MQRTVLLSIGVAAALSAAATAQVMPRDHGELAPLVKRDDRLHPREVLAPIDEVASSLAAEVGDAWRALGLTKDEWTAYVDVRNGHVESAEGAGIPWIPGVGNRLQREDIAVFLGAKPEPDLATLEAIAREFIAERGALFGVSDRELELDPGRSGRAADHLWLVDFNVVRGGLVVEAARIVFRVGHGNLIQFGSELLPPAGTGVPPVEVSREKAFAALAAYVGGIGPPADKILDPGSLHLLPTAVDDSRFPDGFAFGKGYGLTVVWQFVFRREGIRGTWRGRVDASTGEVLELIDTDLDAQAKGGVAADTAAGTETVRPMPFTNIGGGLFTSSAGLFTFGGTPLTSTLNGQFARINDNCGSISLTTNAAGNLFFGTAVGTNCTTPGFGGAGNTRSSRTSFYHVNRAKEMVRGWLPGNAWINGQLTANVNNTGTCNGFWDGASIQLYRAVPGSCGASGEEPGFILHEFGHGVDANDGNGLQGATSESYADLTAAIVLHNSCVGPGFRLGNCGGYGDACTACTGLRDIDWARHASGVPHTVANYTQVNCLFGSGGPCGAQVHCEGHISSEAVWDFANRDLPGPGGNAAWNVLERLWHLSRSTSANAFACTPGAVYTSNGCNVGSWWKTMRAFDDDDGNLANGSPHSCNLFAAFNRHGIACAADAGANVCFRGCVQPAVPAVTRTPGTNQTTLSWTNSGAGVVYDVYRNEIGCNAGFAKVAENVPGTSFVDTGVAGGITYFYQVVAHPNGNEACHASPSTCGSVVPNGICVPNATTLCLQNNRYQARVTWRNIPAGTSGTGTAIPYSNEGGFFWFFGPTNVEMAVKVLDGRPLNGKFWVFHGALTDVEYTLTVTDTLTSAVKTYVKASGSFCGAGDTGAFTPLAGGSSAASGSSFAVPLDVEPAAAVGVMAVCVPNTTTACLLADRFQVRVLRGGIAQNAVEVTSQTGSFWFSSSGNPEVVVKLIDGTPLNGRYWVFFGSLTDQAYQVQVTDSVTSAVKTYNPPAAFCGIGDTTAF